MSRVIVAALLFFLTSPVWGQGTTSPGEDFFSWKIVPGTRLCELYAAGHQIGLYDPDKRAYYRVSPDGTKTGPVAPPFPIRSSTGATQATTTASKAKPPSEPEKGRVTASPEARPWYETLPSWTTYAVGGTITLLITGIGLAMQFRRS